MKEKIDNKWIRNQSLSIDLLRLPLAIAVIFAHLNPKTTSLLEADFPLLSEHGIYNILGIAMSHVLAQIAVPTFFFISGLLFFLNFTQWSLNGYIKKLKNRLRSLLIPYILWNIIALLLPIIPMIVGVLIKGMPVTNIYEYFEGKDLNIFIDYNRWGESKTNLLGWSCYYTGPLELPLWFLRDLIVVSILAPLIFFYVKKTKKYGLTILYVLYITRVWILVPGFSIDALFYFSLGAYFAISKLNIVQFARKRTQTITLLTLLLFPFCVVFDGSSIIFGNYFLPLFIPIAIFLVFSLASISIDKYRISINHLLINSCFFIYVSHTLNIYYKWSPVSLTSEILHTLIPGESIVENIICYILIPFIAALFCICTYKILTLCFPKTIYILTGNKS